MASTIITYRTKNLNFNFTPQNNQSNNTDDEHANGLRTKKSTRASPCDQPEVRSPKSLNHRFRHLYSRFRRHLVFAKEHRTSSEENVKLISKHRLIHLRNSKSFPSTIDESSKDIEWPKLEKAYQSLPSCLINALHGRDNLLMDKKSIDSDITPTGQSSIETMNLFLRSNRGKDFRRNAICLKLDKTQYDRQLVLFVQQQMVKELVWTWS